MYEYAGDGKRIAVLSNVSSSKSAFFDGVCVHARSVCTASLRVLGSDP
jgi:hypothetical protein